MKIHNEHLLAPFYEKKKKNVAIFSDIFYPSLGGVTFVVNNLANALIENGNFNVVVVTGDVKGHKDNVPYPVIRTKSFPIPKAIGDSLPLPAFDRKFKRLLENLNIDVIHTHTVFGIACYGNKFAKKHNIPVIFHGHSKFNEEYQAILKCKPLSAIVARRAFRVVNKADLVVAVSKNTENVYKKQRVNKDIVVVSNATEMTPCDREKAFGYIEEKYGIAKDEKNVMLFVARIEIKTKNIDFLLDSLDFMKKKIPNFKLFIVGDGKDFSALQKLVLEYGFEENVILTGQIRDREILKYYLCRSDLFVFPSVVDTSCLVKYEAATQGTPTLAIENTGASEEIVDGENGFLSAYNVESFGEKIVEIFSDKEKLEKVSQNASSTLGKTWKEKAILLENIFLEQMEKKRECKTYKKAYKKDKIYGGKIVWKKRLSSQTNLE